MAITIVVNDNGGTPTLFTFRTQNSISVKTDTGLETWEAIGDVIPEGQKVPMNTTTISVSGDLIHETTGYVKDGYNTLEAQESQIRNVVLKKTDTLELVLNMGDNTLTFNGFFNNIDINPLAYEGGQKWGYNFTFTVLSSLFVI